MFKSTKRVKNFAHCCSSYGVCGRSSKEFSLRLHSRKKDFFVELLSTNFVCEPVALQGAATWQNTRQGNEVGRSVISFALLLGYRNLHR